MTNLESILLILLWIISGIFLIHKLLQYDGTTFKEVWDYDIFGTLFLSFFTIILNPIIWFGAILYFTFIKPWRD